MYLCSNANNSARSFLNEWTLYQILHERKPGPNKVWMVYVSTGGKRRKTLIKQQGRTERHAPSHCKPIQAFQQFTLNSRHSAVGALMPQSPLRLVSATRLMFRTEETNYWQYRHHRTVKEVWVREISPSLHAFLISGLMNLNTRLQYFYLRAKSYNLGVTCIYSLFHNIWPSFFSPLAWFDFSPSSPTPHSTVPTLVKSRHRGGMFILAWFVSPFPPTPVWPDTL